MRIKELRESKKMTQVALANKLGVTRTAVAMWESGDSMPKAKMLPQLAKELDCTIEEIFEKLA
ncbi:helix-turn-helix domain-containing protein [Eubacteriales bacterium OttesenSCG-928-M02]|nr:helix-turn-helix domain-containing protein [Eubacteriales bacterium OttesenSCG-928-M02]